MQSASDSLLSTSTAQSSPPNWDAKRVRELGQKIFSKRLCWRQIKPALALHEGKDVVNIAGTGSGKTITFLLCLLMALDDGKDVMVFGVTPLIMIGKQLEKQLETVGVGSVNLHAENNNPDIYEDITAGKYHVVTLSPEIMNDAACQDLWKQTKVTSRLLYVVFDEAHCVSQWGSTFRNQYLHVGNIHYLLPSDIPFFVTSATLPPNILADDSNDRSNIHLAIRGLKYPIHSYKDLAFLIPSDFQFDKSPPPKFLIFFDNTTACEDAIHYLRSLLPQEYQDRIKYFHATMTTHYREETFEEFQKGEVWGMAVTDAFGMSLDLPDVCTVVQYRMPNDMCTLWQRFGRAGRDFSLEATAVLLVENSHFDADRIAAMNRKRKPSTQASASAVKRARTDQSHNAATTVSSDAVSSSSPLLCVDTRSQTQSFDLELDCSRSARVARYQKRLSHHVPGARNIKRVEELGTPLDDMVNASSRSITCYREPVNLYFCNDSADKTLHLECFPSSPSGCERCRPKDSRLCCIGCNPNSFSQVALVELPTAPAKLNKSSIWRDYKLSDRGTSIKQALTTWRSEQAPRALGEITVRLHGIRCFMSDEVLLRLASCADCSKLPDVDSIKRETNWREDYIRKYGPSILDVVAQVNSLFFTSRSESGSAGSAQKKCSICNGSGHNKRTCKQHIQVSTSTSESETSAKENQLIQSNQETPKSNAAALHMQIRAPLGAAALASPFPSSSYSTPNTSHILHPSLVSSSPFHLPYSSVYTPGQPASTYDDFFKSFKSNSSSSGAASSE
ncbi:P-loop containing nucleoside triphosphate hydrolase protein [Lentinula raphanica]|nr:P-loop containing nucleoside triphosphate hydrolase protein [Lentinula raphanica]